MLHPLEIKLDALRSRVRRLVLLYGLSAVAATVLAAAIVLGLGDYLVRFQDRGIRIICSLAVLAGLVWTAYRWLYLPLVVRLKDADVAARVQRRFPALEDRLVSAVEFLPQPEDDPTAGSPALRRAVIAQAAAEADRLDFSAAVDRRPPLRAIAAASAVAVLAAVLAVLDPVAAWTAVVRLVNPWSDTAWPQTTHLAIRAPVSRVARGQAFRVEVFDAEGARLPAEVLIHYRIAGPEGAVIETERMQLLGGQMVAQRQNVVRPFSYRVTGGDDQAMGWIAVEVVEPPAVKSLAVTLFPPEYSGWPAEKAEGNLRALVGTRVKFAGRATKPLQSAALCLEGGQRVEAEVSDDGLEFVVDGGLSPFSPNNGREAEQTATAKMGTVPLASDAKPNGGLSPFSPNNSREAEQAGTAKMGTVPLASDAKPNGGLSPFSPNNGREAEQTATAKMGTVPLADGESIGSTPSPRPSPGVSGGFVIEKSGFYWFELTDREGLRGGSETRWEIRAVPDAPPTVTIEEPAGNLFVTPRAVVPLRVAVKEDLVLHRIDLAVLRGEGQNPPETLLPLYVGPEHAPLRSDSPSATEQGQRRTVDYRWELSPLGLKPGVQVVFYATAADYKPQTGKSGPRRLAVITPEELQERIAGRQDLILGELAQVLKTQREGRLEVQSAEIRLAEMGRLDQVEVNRLQAAELKQRQVRRGLTSRSDGVAMHILAVLADLKNNRVDSPDIRRRMQGLLAEIDRLEREHLPICDRELTAAIKSAQVRLPDAAKSAGRDTATAAPLAAAGKQQDQVIAALEGMLGQLRQWDNYRRFHRDLTQLLRDQEDVARGAAEVGRRTLAKDLRDLLPQEVADLKVLAGRQLELARRLDRIEQEMAEAVGRLRASDPLAADTVGDALAEARRLAISGRMRSAAGRLQENQIGQVTGEHKQIAEHLQEVLDILANRRQSELVRLVKKYREAEGDLAALAQKEAGLRKRFDEAAHAPGEAARKAELDRLSREQEDLAREAQQLARRLERLLAERAGRTTGQAAAAMGRSAQSAAAGNAGRAAAEAATAEKTLEQAGRQIAARRLEAQAELAMEQLARLEDSLKHLHRQEENVLEETRRLDGLQQNQGQLTRAQAASLRDLARLQQALQIETGRLAEQLAAAGAFRLALSGAGGEMARAAALLDRRVTGPAAQQAEQNARDRLALVLKALAPESPDSKPDGGGGDSPGGKGGQPGGVQTLAELKMVKLMQEDINARTQQLRQAIETGRELTDDQRRQLVMLGEEQGRLAELAMQFLNPPAENPEDDPAALPEEPEGR